MSIQLLAGLRVVEIGDVTTEYAGKILAELGAEVFLIEEPGGAPTRQRRPFAAVADPTRASIPFLARNSDKRSVVFSADDERDHDALRSLVLASDALLAPSGSPFEEALTSLEPAISIYVDDPDGIAAASLVAFAASGGLSSSGWPHQPPCNAPSQLALDAGGVYAAIAVVVGYRELLRGRQPAISHVSLREAAIAGITPWTRPLHSYGLEAAGQGIGARRLGPTGHPILPASDGYVRVLMGTPRQWEAFIELLGRPTELTGDEWGEPAFRREHTDVVFEIASQLTRYRTRADLFEHGQRLGATITPVNTVADVMDDRHVRERGLFVPISDPDLGSVRAQREPFTLADRPPTAVPALGPSLDGSASDAEQATRQPRQSCELARPDRRGPLGGLRVLNCGVGAVVPEAAELLALLGAEVIKVESRRRVDFLRQRQLNDSPAFNQLNLGVQSIAVDMTQEAGRELVRGIVPHCDIVLENMRAPVMRKWGLDYESVRALRPDVIYFSSQGFGSGPYGDFQTYGPNLQAFSGITASWAHPDDPYPVGTTLNHPDHVAGKQALLPILAALIRREQTGEGASIECAQYEVATELIAERFLQEQLQPGSVAPLGNRSLDFAPHGVYPCAGEDRWCAITVTSEDDWAAFHAAIGEPWSRSESFATVEGRLAHAHDLDLHVASWTAARTVEEVERVLRGAGIPVSRAVTGDDMAANGTDASSGFFVPLDHPTVGTHHYTGLPFTLDDGQRVPLRRPPLLGEHTERVLYDLLELDVESVSELIAQGAVGY